MYRDGTSQLTDKYLPAKVNIELAFALADILIRDRQYYLHLSLGKPQSSNRDQESSPQGVKVSRVMGSYDEKAP
ncbi:hypothetical protein PILCRDRAFT_822932 [Piloderma croceum F 1598]|uniref:Uncharacterized protein n=1 Tax=Piloderma croceum (strain F 1598) TaxID=765440 RepID=A0A0C3B1K5_PILCF|nr:hypothetical protein PILCRDRAFT_822932 [Piloderma croceum F 1598]